MNYQNIKELDIYDCFTYHYKANDIEGYCEKCGIKNATILRMNQIYSRLNILMIILNRGKGFKYDIKINFPLKLNVSQISLNYINPVNELISVIKHLEDNSLSGQFIAFCKCPIPQFRNNWYCYNDKTVFDSNDWKTIHDMGNTYILLYQLKR